MAAGFLAGLLIPSTKVEDEKIGPVADQVKEKAKETGQEALERGKQVAEQAAETAKETGREQAEQLKDSAQEKAAGGPGRVTAEASRTLSPARRSEKRSGRRPEGPAHPRKGGVVQTLKRTIAEFKEDNLTDWAAALTYYAVLSIFPALIALVSVVGLVGDPQRSRRS